MTVIHARLRFLRVIFVGAFGAWLMVAPSAPAHAGIQACIKAAVPIGDAAKATELAAKISACASQAAGGDAVMALATLTTLAAANKFRRTPSTASK